MYVTRQYSLSSAFSTLLASFHVPKQLNKHAGACTHIYKWKHLLMIGHTAHLLQRPKFSLTSYHHPAQDRDCTQPEASWYVALVFLIALVGHLEEILTQRLAQGKWHQAGFWKSAIKNTKGVNYLSQRTTCVICNCKPLSNNICFGFHSKKAGAKNLFLQVWEYAVGL